MFSSRARENTVGTGARVGDHEVQEGAEVGEAVGESEGANHPFEGGVVVAVGINGGGPSEDVEVVVGETGVVVKLGF